MNVYAIKSTRGYLVATIFGRAQWAREMRDDVWQFTTHKAAEELIRAQRVKGARVVKVEVPNA